MSIILCKSNPKHYSYDRSELEISENSLSGRKPNNFLNSAQEKSQEMLTGSFYGNKTVQSVFGSTYGSSTLVIFCSILSQIHLIQVILQSSSYFCFHIFFLNIFQDCIQPSWPRDALLSETAWH